MEGEYEADRAERLGERLFNYLITHVPSHTVRQGWLRHFGVTIGEGTSIMMGTTILGLGMLTIGNNCSIGSDVLLDARGGLKIDDDVVIAGDTQIITGKHIVNSDDFDNHLEPVHIKHHAWIASRCMVLLGVTIGVGAVVGAQSLVTSDVGDMEIAAGVPAKPRGVRKSSLEYHPRFRPILY